MSGDTFTAIFIVAFLLAGVSGMSLIAGLFPGEDKKKPKKTKLKMVVFLICSAVILFGIANFKTRGNGDSSTGLKTEIFKK